MCVCVCVWCSTQPRVAWHDTLRLFASRDIVRLNVRKLAYLQVNPSAPAPFSRQDKTFLLGGGPLSLTVTLDKEVRRRCKSRVFFCLRVSEWADACRCTTTASP